MFNAVILIVSILCIVMLNVVFDLLRGECRVQCRYPDCQYPLYCYAGCGVCIVTQSVVLNAVILGVVMPSVVAPQLEHHRASQFRYKFIGKNLSVDRLDLTEGLKIKEEKMAKLPLNKMVLSNPGKGASSGKNVFEKMRLFSLNLNAKLK